MIRPRSATWPDGNGRFTLVLPSSARGLPVSFWESERQFFSTAKTVPGGPVDMSIYPKSPPTDAPRRASRRSSFPVRRFDDSSRSTRDGGAESPGGECDDGQSRIERGGNGRGAVAGRLLENIETVVHGKREEIRLVLAALVSGGHVLFEDVPGTAKTVLARAIAGSIEGAVPSRVQCTPDLQPTRTSPVSACVFDQWAPAASSSKPGPVFANVLLVDEINRAMPKTQSALLEAMAERQVTVDGITHPLPDPFFLIATENPIEYEGTFPLPGGAARSLSPSARASAIRARPTSS